MEAKLSTTKLSSKGQIIIPKEIRNSLSLNSGDRFVVFWKKGVIILKTLQNPTKNEIRTLLEKEKKKLVYKRTAY